VLPQSTAILKITNAVNEISQPAWPARRNYEIHRFRE